MTNHENHTDGKTIRLRVRNVQETPNARRESNAKNYYEGIFCGSKYVLKQHNNQKIIAVDFDGTLAQLFEPYDPRKAGPPLNPDDKQSIFNQTKRWVKQGKKVVILTARLNSKQHTPAQIKYTRKLLSAWTKHYFGKALPCTSEKHHSMYVIYDDRAVSVNPTTGKIIK